MTPSETGAGAWAEEAPAARTVARTRTSTRASFMICAPCRVGLRRLRELYPKVVVQLVHAGGQRRVLHHVHDPAVLDDVVPVGHGGREVEILLDEQDREALLLESRDRAADLLDDH